MGQPLILALQLDQTAQAFYEDLRRRYFPPERNVISAHVTLFHQLPDEEYIYQTLYEVAQATPAFGLTNPAPRSIGRGVAVFFQSKPLVEVHKTLSIAFQSELSAQDRQPFKPHIVVQNKVDPAKARETLPQIHAKPLVDPQAIGFTLWRYLGGPWEHLVDFAFSDPSLR